MQSEKGNLSKSINEQYDAISDPVPYMKTMGETIEKYLQRKLILGVPIEKPKRERKTPQAKYRRKIECLSVRRQKIPVGRVARDKLQSLIFSLLLKDQPALRDKNIQARMKNDRQDARKSISQVGNKK